MLVDMRRDYRDRCSAIECGIWSANGQVELRCAVTVYGPSSPETLHTFSIPAANASSDRERLGLLAAAMATLRERIDEAITGC